MASDQNSNSHNPTRLEGRVEASQRRDDALENVPDADEARHADKVQIDSAQKTNDNIWRSEGHFAITENGETVARQKTAETDNVVQRSSDLAGGAARNIVDTSVLRAIQTDSSVAEETRFLASQFQEIRRESKVRGYSTEVIDEVAGERLAKEILAKRNLVDKAGTTDAGVFNVADLQKFAETKNSERSDNLTGGNVDGTSLATGPGPDVSRELASNVVDANASQSEPVDRQLAVNATKILIDAATTMYNPERVKQVKIEPDDIGSAYELYWMGPDAVNAMGPERARQEGRRAIAFGVMPLMGALEIANTEFSTKPADVFVKGTFNAVIGTGLGAILELCNPAVGLGLGAYGINSIYADQTGPEHRERNQKLDYINKNVGSMTNDEFIQSSRFVRASLGSLCYEALFGAATGGVSVPGGMGIGAAAKQGAERSFAKSFVDGLSEKLKLPDVLDKLGKLPKAFWESFENPLGKPRLEPVPEGPGLNDTVLQMKKHQGDGEKPQPGKIGDHLEEPYKRWAPHDLSKLMEHPRVKEMLKNLKLSDGKVSVKDGVDVCDIIAESLRGQVPRVDDYNIAFAVIKVDGKQEIVWALAGGKKAPGLQSPDLSLVPPELMPIRDGLNRQYDSEYKILLKLYADLTGNPPKKVTGLSMFTEQKPCDPSCRTTIETFRKMFKDIDFPEVEWKHEGGERQRKNWDRRVFSIQEKIDGK
jgi:hypothetical protein